MSWKLFFVASLPLPAFGKDAEHSRHESFSKLRENRKAILAFCLCTNKRHGHKFASLQMFLGKKFSPGKFSCDREGKSLTNTYFVLINYFRLPPHRAPPNGCENFRKLIARTRHVKQAEWVGEGQMLRQHKKEISKLFFCRSSDEGRTWNFIAQSFKNRVKHEKALNRIALPELTILLNACSRYFPLVSHFLPCY